MTDYTVSELDGRLDKYFGDDKEKLTKGRYQVIKQVPDSCEPVYECVLTSAE